MREGPNVSVQDRATATVRLALLVVAFAFFGASAARAQLFPMYPPVNTTLVISKPAPGEPYATKQIITMGVGAKKYRFVLDDAYVDSTRIRWPDIWEQARVHRPNFVVQGPHTDEIEHLRPGERITVKAMYAPLDRTFEVIFTQAGRGPFEPKEHY
jgi:hypothetical protein